MQWPAHPLPSHGRIDQPDTPAPFRVIGPSQPTQPSQPAEQPTFTQQAYSQVLGVHRAHRDYLAQADSDLTDRQRAKYAAAFDGSTQLDVLEQAFNRQEQAYQADYQASVAARTANVDESAALRIRDRLLRKLENADQKQVAAQEIISNCPDAELGVALQELPSYLEANQLPADFIEQVLRTRCPEVADKAARLRKAKQANIIGRETIRQVRAGIRNAAPPSVLMKPEDVEKYDPEK
jgi:hypothetical protein